jgi:hypothetical protein
MSTTQQGAISRRHFESGQGASRSPALSPAGSPSEAGPPAASRARFRAAEPASTRVGAGPGGGLDGAAAAPPSPPPPPPAGRCACCRVDRPSSGDVREESAAVAPSSPAPPLARFRGGPGRKYVAIEGPKAVIAPRAPSTSARAKGPRSSSRRSAGGCTSAGCGTDGARRAAAVQR